MGSRTQRWSLVALALFALHCGSSDCDPEHPCGPGQVCVSKKCQAGPDLEEPCKDGCPKGQQCVSGQDFPGGACTINCALSGGDCPQYSSCTQLITGSYCLEGCEADTECPQGYSCIDAGSKVCVAPSVDPLPIGHCAALPHLVAGGMVGPATAPTGCQRNVSAPALPASRVQRLGVHSVGETVSFAVPPDLASLTVVEQAVQAIDTIEYQGITLDNSAVPLQLLLPDGGVLYDDSLPFPLDPTSAELLFSGDTPVIGTLTFPNSTPGLALTTQGGVPAGTWSMVVNDYAFECLTTPDCDGGSASGSYDVSVIAQPPHPNGGSLDLAIYLVTSSGLTSARAVSNQRFVRAVGTIEAIYAQAGLCLRTVTVYDVPDWAKNRYAASINVDQPGPCSDLSQMFTLAQPGDTLNLFFVDALLADAQRGGTVLVGIDGSIPGPSSMGGTVSSGAAVSMGDLSAGDCTGGIAPMDCGADEIGFIAAHEGGHWLGLFHTSEGTGTDFDPLADTPACICDYCAPPGEAKACANHASDPNASPTFLSGTDCRAHNVVCGGGSNLMFWEINPVSAGDLSPEQAKVMLANPLVQ